MLLASYSGVMAFSGLRLYEYALLLVMAYLVNGLATQRALHKHFTEMP